jgi:hypothetical protein
MDGSADSAMVAAAFDLAAGQAAALQVDVRVVYGREALPSWPATWQLLAGLLARTGQAHPGVVLSVAVYPGTTADALLTANESASLVVLAAPGLADDGAPAEQAVLALTPDELCAVQAMAVEPVAAH